jgi:hypothetical protein
MFDFRETKVSLGQPPGISRERCVMFALILAVVLIVLFFSTGRAIWYARSGRFEMDNRLSAVTRR